MLLVKTTLSQSAIHGLGVMATEPIAAGAEIWRFQEGFDLEKSPEEITALPYNAQEWFKRFGYLDHRHNQYILSFDDARFINHSDNPNVRPNYEAHKCGVGIAARAIAAGEELTINYREIEKASFLDCKV
jgi:SET domain-containing protein